jgi:sarcosine oxidase
MRSILICFDPSYCLFISHHVPLIMRGCRFRFSSAQGTAKVEGAAVMANRYNVIVLRIGGMGSATAYHLAGRGLQVLGLEQFDIPNTRGSSHGITRIIRLAYYEHPDYIPLLVRAYELWRHFERQFGKPLLHITGSIDAGTPDSEVFARSRRSCELYGLRHELLPSSELTRRFPAYNLPSEMMAVLQADGGFPAPERWIVAHTQMAQAHGAEIHSREHATAWEAAGAGVFVTTDRGVYQADRLVIAAGA